MLAFSSKGPGRACHWAAAAESDAWAVGLSAGEDSDDIGAARASAGELKITMADANAVTNHSIRRP